MTHKTMEPQMMETIEKTLITTAAGVFCSFRIMTKVKLVQRLEMKARMVPSILKMTSFAGSWSGKRNVGLEINRTPTMVMAMLNTWKRPQGSLRRMQAKIET